MQWPQGCGGFKSDKVELGLESGVVERALGLFSPFTGTGPSESKNDHAQLAAPKEPSAETPRSDDEIANLKAELTAMKERLDELSRR